MDQKLKSVIILMIAFDLVIAFMTFYLIKKKKASLSFRETNLTNDLEKEALKKIRKNFIEEACGLTVLLIIIIDISLFYLYQKNK